MRLSEHRCRFTSDVALLIRYAEAFPGWRVALDETKRTPELAAEYAAKGIGVTNSLHIEGLAADVLLYIDGEYQRRTEAYIALGEFWEGLGPYNVWGGRFRDGNHFERRRRAQR